jgi:hypothetical protein
MVLRVLEVAEDSHVNEHIYSNSLETPLSILQELHSIPEVSINGEDEIYYVKDSDRSLYIHQGEIAINISIDDFDVFGSDDATSCHILLLKNMKGQWLIVHLDTVSRVRSCFALLSEFLGSSHNAEVYVSGGIDDMQSTEISLAIIELLLSFDSIMDICMFSTCKCNMLTLQDSVCRPKFIGLGYTKGKGVVPVYFPDSLRGPEFILRSCSTWCSNSDEIKLAYDGSEHLFIIEPFVCQFPLEIAHYFLSLSDEKLLEKSSTTPKYERPRYIHDARRTLELILTPEVIQNYFINESESADPTSESNDALPIRLSSVLYRYNREDGFKRL